MLLGEYEHTIEDKSRLTRPARSRQSFTEGVIVSRGVDGCVSADRRADEVRASLAVRPGETVVDATFGAGGHAALLAADLQGRGTLIAIDRDPTARMYFARFEKRAGVQARLLSGDFGAVLQQLSENGVRADAILLDLG